MRPTRFPVRNIAIVIAASVTLGGCATYYGGGGYGGGYGGLSVGIGTGGYYNPYYGGSGYYGGSPYWGWNDGYYYPGAGYYVYDSYRRPHRWSDTQRRYWTQRRAALGATAIQSTNARPNWSGFTRARTTTTAIRPDRQQRIQARIERRQSNKASVGTSTERPRETRPARLSRTAPHQDDRGEAHDRDVVLVGDGRLGAE